jgi:hypothetical protein
VSGLGAIALAVAAWIAGGLPAGARDRLEGQRITLAADGATFAIDDIAGEGVPLVGTVERRGAALWLVVDGGPALRLAGPLARPRLAGPGYRIWAIGDSAGDTLTLRRLGVLAPPPR